MSELEGVAWSRDSVTIQIASRRPAAFVRVEPAHVDANAHAAVAAIKEGWALLSQLRAMRPDASTLYMPINHAILRSASLPHAWPAAQHYAGGEPSSDRLRRWLGRSHFRYVLVAPCRLCSSSMVGCELTYSEARDALAPSDVSPEDPLWVAIYPWRSLDREALYGQLAHEISKLTQGAGDSAAKRLASAKRIRCLCDSCAAELASEIQLPPGFPHNHVDRVNRHRGLVGARDALEELGRLGVRFVFEETAPGGGCRQILTPAEAADMLESPVDVLAGMHGVSPDQYVAWQRAGMAVPCAGRTARGEPCKNKLHGGQPVSVESWVSQLGGYCHVHACRSLARKEAG